MTPEEKALPAEPTPPPAVAGGPGSAPPPVETRATKIGQREFQLPADVADAYAQREKDYEAGFQKQGQELGELRSRLRDYEAQQERLRTAIAPNTRAAEPDTATLLFTDPQKALEQHEQRIYARLNAERQQERDRESFWSEFYGGQPDLSRADDHWLVEAIMQRNFRDLATMSVADGQKKLGDLTRQAMLSILKKKGAPANGAARTTVEGGSARPAKAAEAPDEDGPKSLSDVIKARQQRRRAPQSASR